MPRLANNPDLIAARESAKASGYDIDTAGAGRLPKLELYTSGSYQDYLGTLGSGIGGGSSPQVSTAAQAGVRFTMPLFQGGRVAAQQRQAQANASAALEQVVSTERNIIAQVRASLLQLASSERDHRLDPVGSRCCGAQPRRRAGGK